jgi:UDP-N-acetyl-D-mannosaminuronate dehydrogenase
LGFAYKGNPPTDDTRESSTFSLIAELKKKISPIYGYDPVVNYTEIEKSGAIPTEIEKGFENADCVIFMNNHKSFLDLDIKKLLLKTSKPCIFVDCWSMFKKIENEEGIIYSGIGINSMSDLRLEKNLSNITKKSK